MDLLTDYEAQDQWRNWDAMPLQVRTIQDTSAWLVYLQKRKLGVAWLGANKRRTTLH